jgi:hypothetical protein
MAYQRSVPTFNPDGTAIVTPSRVGSHNEAYTLPLGASKQSLYADEGSYFSAYNVTDGTGIVGPVAVQSDLSLKPLLHIFNSNTAASGKSIIVDFLRLRVTAIGSTGVAGTTTDFTTWVDQAGATCKTSGGTVATVVNCRSDNPIASGAVVSFGAVVCTAHASERRLDHQRVRSVIPVVEDQYNFSFGPGGYLLASAVATSGTNAISTYTNFSPAVILPGGNFKVAIWEASMTSTGNSYEYTIGWTER